MSEVITSAQNPRIKKAAALRERRERDATDLMLIDGAREMDKALLSGVVFECVYVCPALAGGDVWPRSGLWEENNIPFVEVTEAVYRKMAYGDKSDGVCAVARQPDVPDAVGLLTSLSADALILIVEGVEKPGNIGAMLRTADAAGVAALCLCDAATDVFNPNVIRASLGTVFTVPVVSGTREQVWLALKGGNRHAFAASPDAERVYFDEDFSSGAVFVLGSESRGLTSFWQDKVRGFVRVPMAGSADSLNVSVTAAVLVYEAVRQKTGAGRNEP